MRPGLSGVECRIKRHPARPARPRCFGPRVEGQLATSALFASAPPTLTPSGQLSPFLQHTSLFNYGFLFIFFIYRVHPDLLITTSS